MLPFAGRIKALHLPVGLTAMGKRAAGTAGVGMRRDRVLGGQNGGS
jgi:hypothetical protein